MPAGDNVFVAELQCRFNHIAHTAMAAGIGDLPVVFNFCPAADCLVVVVLMGMDFEVHPELTVDVFGLNVEGVQRRAAGAGIHFGLESRYA